MWLRCCSEKLRTEGWMSFCLSSISCGEKEVELILVPYYIILIKCKYAFLSHET
jgi:hypothetical protein